MEISFEHKDLRSICENEEVAIRQFGEEITYQIQDRLSDIFAASNVYELYAGNPQRIGGFPFLNYYIDLTNGYKLEFCANNTKKTFFENGELDWSKVSRIKIVNIYYNHE